MPADKPINIRFYTDYPVCNFKCTYCVAGQAMAEGRPPSPWNEDNYMEIVRNLIKLDFPANVRIGVGGEFFISKTLVEGARLLSNADCIVGLNLITNLSFSTSQYSKIFEGFDQSKIAIVASFHPTEIEDIDAWISTAEEMSKLFDLVTMSVAYPSFISSMPEIKKRLNNVGLEFFVQPFMGNYEGRIYPDSYSNEELQIIRDVMYSRHDHEFLLKLKHPGLCNAGFRYLYVSPVGKVTPCGGANHGIELGDLMVSSQIRRREGPRPCPTNCCQCDTENLNTVIFENHYELPGLNQHRFNYRFSKEAKKFPWMGEWEIDY